MKKMMTVLAMVILLSGCVLGTTRVKLNHDPFTGTKARKQGITILVNRFEDVRTVKKQYIGNKRNAYGIVMGHIGTEEGVDLTEVLTKYFAEVLEEAGYTVISNTKDKSDAAVEGKIVVFWMDLYMAVWHKVEVEIVAKDHKGRVLYRGIVNGEQTNILWIGATSEYEKVIRQAITKAVNKAVQEFSSEQFYRVIKGEEKTP